MGRGMNSAKAAHRDRMRRYGSESIADDQGAELEAMLREARRSRKPKAKPSRLRADADKAAASKFVIRKVQCVCGRRATVRVPVARRNARLRCSRCGTLAG